MSEQQRAQDLALQRGAAMNNGQTTFEYGHDHFSRDHANHHHGSTAPVQRDLGLRYPDGSFKKLSGEASPAGTVVQTDLYDFAKINR
jgi:hypothetical protein